MARDLDEVLARLPAKRRAKIEARAAELATLRDLRQAVKRTQVDMAARLGVRQDTISRIENRSDMLLSTLRRYIAAMGGDLELVAHFPNRPPLKIEQLTAARPAGLAGPKSTKRNAAGRRKRVPGRQRRPGPRTRR